VARRNVSLSSLDKTGRVSNPTTHAVSQCEQRRKTPARPVGSATARSVTPLGIVRLSDERRAPMRPDPMTAPPIAHDNGAHDDHDRHRCPRRRHPPRHDHVPRRARGPLDPPGPPRGRLRLLDVRETSPATEGRGRSLRAHRTRVEDAEGHDFRMATARTTISVPSTRTSAWFLCRNVGSTKPVTCRYAQGALPHKYRHGGRVASTARTGSVLLSRGLVVGVLAVPPRMAVTAGM
jgi:hypothetical protein